LTIVINYVFIYLFIFISYQYRTSVQVFSRSEWSNGSFYVNIKLLLESIFFVFGIVKC